VVNNAGPAFRLSTIGTAPGDAAIMKRLVIVGGGYAGFALARSLDAVADVVLVEPRDHFVHNVAAMRALVQPELIGRIVIPYDRLLTRGQVVQARAVDLQDRLVRLSDGRSFEGDAIVVATGSSYASPFKPMGDDVAGMLAASKAAHEQLRSARSVAIVGAGAVGTELAGEIAAAMPGKAVTLVSTASTLFPGYSPRLGRSIEAQLTRMGVSLRLGAHAHELQRSDAPFTGRVEMREGAPIEADLVFPAVGARPVTNLLQALDGARLDAIGRVEVDGWLRPSSNPRLFALGDAIATGDGMTIVSIMRQQPWLTRTLEAVLAGAAVESLPHYAPWPQPPILIPLGATKGASVLPLTRRGIVIGPFLTAAIKGRGLFIPRYQKEFGRT
jgi:NADH dehydrogenase FAD-containing subunit